MVTLLSCVVDVAHMSSFWAAACGHRLRGLRRVVQKDVLEAEVREDVEQVTQGLEENLEEQVRPWTSARWSAAS